MLRPRRSRSGTPCRFEPRVAPAAAAPARRSAASAPSRTRAGLAGPQATLRVFRSCGRSSFLSFRTSHGADLSARSAAAIEQVCPVGLEPPDAGAARHLQPLEHGAAFRVDSADIALVAFPGAAPQLAVDPGHAGDEARALAGAQNG